MRILDELTNDKNITEVIFNYKECIYTKPGIWMQWNKLYTCQIHVFENLGMKRKRCGTCTGCKQTHDCGICVFCKDKSKYGGPGKLKQCCKLKKCTQISGKCQVNPTK